ncbi:hypothetical protein Ddc_00039 [Ditylenchus destructor]|nr:hypothetical protein Ddc_00039 [Ditylenchus destructor]
MSSSGDIVSIQKFAAVASHQSNPSKIVYMCLGGWFVGGNAQLYWPAPLCVRDCFADCDEQGRIPSQQRFFFVHLKSTHLIIAEFRLMVIDRRTH